MNYLIAFICIVIIVWRIYRSFGNFEKDTSTENSNDVDFEIENFDEAFFEQTNKGEKYQHFLSLSSQKDCALIRGILQADNVPTYTEGEHMNNIYGGIDGSMNAVVAIKVYILYKDYDRALEIISDYIRLKVERINSEEDKNYGEKILEALSSLSFSNSNSGCEILGIVILPKAKMDDLLED